MDPTDLENDLNDLIEGTLDQRRAESLRQKLIADPELARLAKQLSDDRAILIGLSRATESASRADRAGTQELVARAIRRAERDALLETGGRRRSRAPILIAAGIALFAVLVGFLLSRPLLTRPAPGPIGPPLAADLPPAGGMMSAVESTPGAPTPTPALESSETPGRESLLPSWMPLSPDPSASKQIESWSQEIAERLNEEPDASAIGLRADAILAELSAQGRSVLSPAEAATLAQIRKIRLVIPAGAVRQGPAHAGTELARAPATEGAVRAFRLRLNVPRDPASAALADELERVRSSYRAPGGEEARFELSVDGAEAPGTLPGLELDDLLWWSGPPSARPPTMSVVILVEPAGAPPKPR